ncbi:MAG: lysophospholipid acyltransferase family protein [Desulfuromonas sp.]|nr:lysophospholipid acyltransferase family protein [Desulfuromonas sp.]
MKNRSRRAVKSASEYLLIHLVPPLAVVCIHVIYLCSKREIVVDGQVQEMWQRKEKMILSFWHDQLLLMARAYKFKAQILISASQDGELIARAMAYMGQKAVRGSSSKGGSSAFKQLLRLTREPYDLVITPDGPRGPRHEIKEGVVHLARLSKRGVVPMSMACSRGHRFASWDRFLLPYPFGRLVFIYGPPLYYDTNETSAHFHQRLSAAMDATAQQARDYLENHGLSAV